MGNLGATEILLIFLVVLLLFGARRIPEIARGLGKGIREFKDATTDIKRELIVDDTMRPTLPPAGQTYARQPYGADPAVPASHAPGQGPGYAPAMPGTPGVPVGAPTPGYGPTGHPPAGYDPAAYGGATAPGVSVYGAPAPSYGAPAGSAPYVTGDPAHGLPSTGTPNAPVPPAAPNDVPPPQTSA